MCFNIPIIPMVSQLVYGLMLPVIRQRIVLLNATADKYIPFAKSKARGMRQGGITKKTFVLEGNAGFIIIKIAPFIDHILIKAEDERASNLFIVLVYVQHTSDAYEGTETRHGFYKYRPKPEDAVETPTFIPMGAWEEYKFMDNEPSMEIRPDSGAQLLLQTGDNEVYGMLPNYPLHEEFMDGYRLNTSGTIVGNYRYGFRYTLIRNLVMGADRAWLPVYNDGTIDYEAKFWGSYSARSNWKASTGSEELEAAYDEEKGVINKHLLRALNEFHESDRGAAANTAWEAAKKKASDDLITAADKFEQQRKAVGANVTSVYITRDFQIKSLPVPVIRPYAYRNEFGAFYENGGPKDKLPTKYTIMYRHLPEGEYLDGAVIDEGYDNGWWNTSNQWKDVIPVMVLDKRQALYRTIEYNSTTRYGQSFSFTAHRFGNHGADDAYPVTLSWPINTTTATRTERLLCGQNVICQLRCDEYSIMHNEIYIPSGYVETNTPGAPGMPQGSSQYIRGDRDLNVISFAYSDDRQSWICFYRYIQHDYNAAGTLFVKDEMRYTVTPKYFLCSCVKGHITTQDIAQYTDSKSDTVDTSHYGGKTETSYDVTGNQIMFVSTNYNKGVFVYTYNMYRLSLVSKDYGGYHQKGINSEWTGRYIGVINESSSVLPVGYRDVVLWEKDVEFKNADGEINFTHAKMAAIGVI